jgi:shikimate 5-dehydrogenase
MNHPNLNFHSNSASKTREEYQKAYENYEIEYWCNKFGVSSDKLKQAIAAVGLSVDAVENYLKANGVIK